MYFFSNRSKRITGMREKISKIKIKPCRRIQIEMSADRLVSVPVGLGAMNMSKISGVMSLNSILSMYSFLAVSLGNACDKNVH